MQVPQQISEAWRPYADPQLPAVFTGGWVGYCGYDTVRYGYSGQLQPCSTECASRMRCCVPDCGLHSAPCVEVQMSDQDAVRRRH